MNVCFNAQSYGVDVAFDPQTQARPVLSSQTQASAACRISCVVRGSSGMDDGDDGVQFEVTMRVFLGALCLVHFASNKRVRGIQKLVIFSRTWWTMDQHFSQVGLRLSWCKFDLGRLGLMFELLLRRCARSSVCPSALQFGPQLTLQAGFGSAGYAPRRFC